MQNKITQENLIDVLKYVFDVSTELSTDSDLSEYIQDSIDLGEVIAVIKNKYSIEPGNKELFRKYKKLGEILKVFNNEITS